MIPRLRHWWRRACGEYIRTPGGGGDVMKLQWDW